MILSFLGLDFLTALSKSISASAISNVGPGVGEIIGPMEIIEVLMKLENGFWRLRC